MPIAKSYPSACRCRRDITHHWHDMFAIAAVCTVRRMRVLARRDRPLSILEKALSDGGNAKAGEAKLFAEGLALYKAGKFAETEALCQQALISNPRNADLWNLRGVNARNAKRYTEAVAFLRQGLAFAPQNAALWTNLGNVLKDIKQCETAVVCHRRALAIEPERVSTLHNLGIAQSAAGREADALATYDRALRLDPGNMKVRWDRALSLLRSGDFAGGWRDYELRYQALPSRALPGARWTGERYEGKRLLVVSEQGLGDTIWVARYLEKVKALGGELIVECRREVIGLIAAMGIADGVVQKGEALPGADFNILQCSLPGIFTKEEGDIPSAPYIQAQKNLPPKISEAMSGADGRLKVGIIWGGSVTYEGRADRDAPLRAFLQWCALPTIQLYSLQKGPQADDLKSLPAGAPIIDLGSCTADLAETAAAVAELDLVLMTDTAVAHLAGALGKPVWLLLNRVPHWLWQTERGNTPWYPSMRLFRQRTWGDWNGVFDEAAAALLSLSDGQREA